MSVEPNGQYCPPPKVNHNHKDNGEDNNEDDDDTYLTDFFSVLKDTPPPLPEALLNRAQGRTLPADPSKVNHCFLYVYICVRVCVYVCVSLCVSVYIGVCAFAYINNGIYPYIHVEKYVYIGYKQWYLPIYTG